MPIGNTVKHGWILLLFVSLYITKHSEAVLQWGMKKVKAIVALLEKEDEISSAFIFLSQSCIIINVLWDV